MLILRIQILIPNTVLYIEYTLNSWLFSVTIRVLFPLLKTVSKYPIIKQKYCAQGWRNYSTVHAPAIAVRSTKGEHAPLHICRVYCRAARKRHRCCCIYVHAGGVLRSPTRCSISFMVSTLCFPSLFEGAASYKTVDSATTAFQNGSCTSAFPNKCTIKHPFPRTGTWKVWKLMKTTSLCSVWKKETFWQYYINSEPTIEYYPSGWNNYLVYATIR